LLRRLTSSLRLPTSGLWLLTSGLFLFTAGCASQPRPTAHRTVLPPKPAAIVLPAEIIKGHFFVVTQWDANGPWRFLVDTGSKPTLVSPEFARRYATDEPAADMPAVRVRSASGGTTQLPGVRLPAIVLGAARFEDVTALVYDCDELSGQFGRKIDGILGFPLFRELLLTLDYPGAKLELIPAADAPPLFGVVAPLLGGRTGPVVTAQLDGQTLEVLLDSGADGMLHLNPTELAPRYAVEPRPGVMVGTLTGDRLQEIGRLADDLAVGGALFTRPVVELTDQPSSLGSDVLRQFRLTFDVEHGQVAFERDPGASGAVVPVRSAGLSFRRYPAYWRVLSVVPGSPADAAGIETGDLVIRVNDERVERWGLDRYDELVRTATVIDFTLLNGRVETPARIPTFDLVP
jgi:predicted aspartyl protease